MCGIAGFIGSTGNESQDKSILAEMTKCIEHRGPDDEGIFIDGPAHLGFRRLAIIDLETGHQPMTDPETGITITFNGEIYNYRALREGLSRAGHTFFTESDTEVLLHMYIEYGAEMLMKLRGMFAFVIWDPTHQTLFGARDFFGIKPLYYTIASPSENRVSAAHAQSNRTPLFIYASEIKAILEHPAYEKRLNTAGLDQYLSFQYSVQHETLFAGIFRLAPGHCFTYTQEAGMEVQRYFDPLPFSGKGAHACFDETVDAVSRIIDDSVQAHMVADVEVGSLLSSGIDSTYITALYPNRKTYTIGCEASAHTSNAHSSVDYAPETSYNEIGYAKESAALLGKENTSRVVTPEEYWDVIPEVMYYLDEPLGDASCIMLYLLDQMVAEDVKVVLSGEGADEFFCGYPIYHEPFSLARYQQLPEGIRRAIAQAARRLPALKNHSFLQRGAFAIEDRFIGNAYVFHAEERARILKQVHTEETPQDLTRPHYRAVNRVPYIDDTAKMQYIDDVFWLPGDILLKADKMSMAHSLESRVPFIDMRVFELARTLPLDYRMKDDKNSPDGVLAKRALRAAAARHLPERITARKKRGFPTPIRVWLAQPDYRARVEKTFTSADAEQFFDTQELMRLLDEHGNGAHDYSREIWTVYAFLIWYDIFFSHGPAYERVERALAGKNPTKRRV